MSWLRRSPRPRPLGPSVAFVHVAAIGPRYQEIVDGLLDKLVSSRLVDALDFVHVNVVGPGQLDCGVLEGHVEIVQSRSGSLDDFEFATLELVHDHARAHAGQSLLYIHSKGVTKETPEHKQAIGAWVEVMTERLISRHAECLEHLRQGYDTVGVDWANFYEGQPTPGHYSGNFWWASTDYLRRLPELSKVREAPMRFGSVRHNAEFWIGLGRPHSVCICEWLGTAYRSSD